MTKEIEFERRNRTSVGLVDLLNLELPLESPRYPVADVDCAPSASASTMQSCYDSQIPEERNLIVVLMRFPACPP